MAEDVLDVGDIESENASIKPRSSHLTLAREKHRHVLSLASFVLLAVCVLGILTVVAIGQRTWPEMQGVTSAVLPAVLSIASLAFGYAFGRRGGQ